MFRPRAKGRNWEVVDVARRARPGPGITWELMNGGKSDPRISDHDRFRAVAMVGIEVPDRDARCALLQGIECRDCNVIEETKAHRLVGGGVVSRRPHQAESALPAQCQSCDLAGGASCARGMLKNPRIGRRISIEIRRRGAHPCDLIRRVRATDLLLVRFVRQTPFPGGMRRLEVRRAGCYPGGSLGMTDGRILGAARIVQEDHLPGCLTRWRKCSQ